MELSELSRTCLAHMPVLVNTITATVNDLNRMLSPYHEEFRMLLRESFANHAKGKYMLSGKDGENQVVYPFIRPSDYKVLCERKAGILESNLQILYLIPFQKLAKKSDELFELRIIYTSNSEWNGIWFRLWEITQKRILSDAFREEVKQRVSTDWDIYSEERSIEIGFNIAEDVSQSKINQCAVTFKKEILLPFLAALLPV
jgi:Zn/Cd-binding protein ZinT